MAGMKKIPMRKCLGCMQSKPKKELIRIVRNAKTGIIQLDTTGKVSGRGTYFCPNDDCFKKALDRDKLEKALDVQITDEDIERLREEYDKIAK